MHVFLLASESGDILICILVGLIEGKDAEREREHLAATLIIKV